MIENSVEAPAQAEAQEQRGQRNVLVPGFEERVQLFAPVEECVAAPPILPGGAIRAGYDFNHELEALLASTQPFSKPPR